jgi:hypothetical protein
MKYAVIADVAGQYDALMRLVAKIPAGYEIILLGDLVDRGSDGDLVIEWAIQNNIRSVLANHEHMMYDYYRTHTVHGMYGATYRDGAMYDRDIWLMNGGHATNWRYKQSPSAEATEARSTHLLEKHLDWIKQLPLSISLPVDNMVAKSPGVVNALKDQRPVHEHVFTEVMVTHAPLHARLSDREIDKHEDFSEWTKLERSILWNRSSPIRREYFQLNGHNSHWGLQVYDDDKGAYGWCLDDSRREKLTCMLLPEQVVVQENYLTTSTGY